MFDSARDTSFEKKAWTAPAIEEFKVEEITQNGGPDTLDGIPQSLAASS